MDFIDEKNGSTIFGKLICNIKQFVIIKPGVVSGYINSFISGWDVIFEILQKHSCFTDAARPGYSQKS